MRPDGGRVLDGVARNIMTWVVPEVSTPFGVTTAGMCVALTAIVSQEFDRIVDRLLTETDAVASILRDAAPLLEDAGLREKALAAAANTTPENYRVSTVQALNDAIRAVLIDVHTAIEATPGPDAAALNDRIWGELQESTQRRQVVLLPANPASAQQAERG